MVLFVPVRYAALLVSSFGCTPKSLLALGLAPTLYELSFHLLALSPHGFTSLFKSFFGIHASFLPCVSSFLYVDSFFVCRYTFPNFLPLSEACRVLLHGLLRLCMCKGLPEYDRVEGGVPF